VSDDMVLAAGKPNLQDFKRIIHFSICFPVRQLSLILHLFLGSLVCGLDS
jgi:hypothetical protein